MFGFIKNLSHKLSNGLSAPGTEESDGYYEDYYDDDYEDEYYDEQAEPSRQYKQERSSSRRTGSAKAPVASRTPSRSSSSYSSSNVLPINSGNNGLNLHRASETIITHPRNLEDAVEIGSHIRSGRMCIVDLTDAGADAQRIADYLCGSTDALDGGITRVNNSIITVAPSNHRVMPDYREESQYEAPRYMRAANDR